MAVPPGDKESKRARLYTHHRAHTPGDSRPPVFGPIFHLTKSAPPSIPRPSGLLISCQAFCRHGARKRTSPASRTRMEQAPAEPREELAGAEARAEEEERRRGVAEAESQLDNLVEHPETCHGFSLALGVVTDASLTIQGDTTNPMLTAHHSVSKGLEGPSLRSDFLVD